MGAGGSSEREVIVEEEDGNEAVGPSIKVQLSILTNNTFPTFYGQR